MKKIYLNLTALFSFILLFIPLEVFGHGTEAEHASEEATNYWSYGLWVALIVLIISSALYVFSKNKAKNIDMKKKINRDKQKSILKSSKISKWTAILSAVLSVLFIIMINTNSEMPNEEGVKFTHIHGLGYSSDGKEVYVPAHDGLRIYNGEKWIVPTLGEKHDYMGFSMFKGGFYSSGHPSPSSDLANPLGIVKSTDKGENIEILDLYEEIDFHGMTVGYETRDIYVFNPSENSRMDQAGFYYSTDETKTWHQSNLEGLEGQATSLAAHPTDEGVVAIGTAKGIYLSNNYGDNFNKLPVTGSVSAVSFDHQNNLLVATQTDQEKLYQVNLPSNEVNELSTPTLDDDPITYVKQNPINEKEFVFSTSKKNIYFSYDGGKSWDKSVDEGVAR